MREIRKGYLCELIKVDCINMINEKNVNLEELAFDLGISLEELLKVFNERCEDFTIYLKTYNLLMER